MKKKIIAVLLLLSISFLVIAVAEAAPATNNVSITQVVKLIVNGKIISTGANEEPVILKGRTFVPIRIVAEALNLKVNWDNKLKTVKVTGKTDSEADSQKDKTIKDLKAQLAQKDKEIKNLQDQIDSLKKGTDLGDLEDNLNSDYDYLESVKIDGISLDGDENDVTVNIKVNLDNYGSKWAKLTDSEIKNWIKSLVNSIQDELSEDTQVTGKIIDNDSNDTLVKFTKDGTSSLSVSYKDEDYRGVSESDIQDVKDSLRGDSFSIGGILFSVNNIKYNTDNDRISVALKAKTADAATAWDKLSSRQINSGVKAVCKTISDAFIEDANANPWDVYIDICDDSLDVLDGYTYDVDSGDLT